MDETMTPREVEQWKQQMAETTPTVVSPRELEELQLAHLREGQILDDAAARALLES